MTTEDCPFCRKLAAPDRLPAEELVWQFPHSVALLGPWQYYQGYCVLVARSHVTELHLLAEAQRRAYFDELMLLSRAITDCFRPHKLNTESLGNQVPHLHWHVFPRSANDPDAPRPVWLALDRAERDETERRRLQTSKIDRLTTAAQLRQRLSELTL